MALTKRQRECLTLVADLRSSKEIAAALGLSPHTVDGYINEAVTTLGAADRFEAARIYVARLAAPPQRSTGEASRVETNELFRPSVLRHIVTEVATEGRIVRLGRPTRILLIVGLTIGIIYAVSLLTLGSEVLDRYAKRFAQPDTIHMRPPAPRLR